MESGSVNTWFTNGLLVIVIVFVALALLWLVVSALSGILRKMEKKPRQEREKDPQRRRLKIVLAVCCVAAPILLVVGITLMNL